MEKRINNNNNILSNMIKEHNIKQNISKEMQEKRKNEAIVAAHQLTELTVEHLNTRISYAYNNQKRLDVECKKLENKSTNLIKYAEQWVDLVEQMNQTLKEIGDVENWSKVMERDVTSITNILKQTNKQSNLNEKKNERRGEEKEK